MVLRNIKRMLAAPLAALLEHAVQLMQRVPVGRAHFPPDGRLDFSNRGSKNKSQGAPLDHEDLRSGFDLVFRGVICG